MDYIYTVSPKNMCFLQ